MSFAGNIKLYTGPMFGGKSNSLMNEYDKYSRVHKKCLLIRYISDNRYENHITHNKNYNVIINKEDEYIQKECKSPILLDNIEKEDKKILDIKKLSSGVILNEIKCKYLYDVDYIVKDYDAIFIDEIQFFEDCDIFCEKWANENKIIRLAGLLTTSNRELFKNIYNLIPLIEKIEYCSAVCTDNNNEIVYFTDRNSDNKDEIVIGSDETYKPVDRKTWFNNISNYISLYTRLIKRYNEEFNKHNNTNIELDNDKLINYLNLCYPKNIIFKDCLLICSKNINKIFENNDKQIITKN